MNREPVPQIFEVVSVVMSDDYAWDEARRQSIHVGYTPVATVRCEKCRMLAMVSGFGRREMGCCGNRGHFRIEMGPNGPECGLVAADILLEPVREPDLTTRNNDLLANQ